MPGHHTTKSAAALVGISVATLRNHTVTFSEYLSADASPPTGQERRLHNQDIAVLQRVVELRKQGMTTEAIKQTLQDEDISALVPYVDVVATVTTVEPQQALEAPQQASMATVDATVIVQALQAIQSHQEVVAQRMTDLEQVQVERFQTYIMGVLSGIIIVLVVLGILWLGASLR